VGLLVIWLLTGKLNVIIKAIRQFQQGNLNARIAVRNNNELDMIGLVFNEMADTIARNITELKETDEFRKELIGNVSHDLRTPLPMNLLILTPFRHSIPRVWDPAVK